MIAPRTFFPFALVLLVLGCAQQPPGPQVAQAAPAAATPPPARVCDDTPMTGSRVGHRSCRSAAQSERDRIEAERAIEEVRQNQAMPRR